MDSIWEMVTFGSCSWVKNLTAKSDFVKAWLLWWAITILVLFILSLTTTLNLRSIGIGLSFGFCQILGRYTMSLGWSKYWGVLGYFL